VVQALRELCARELYRHGLEGHLDPDTHPEHRRSGAEISAGQRGRRAGMAGGQPSATRTASSIGPGRAATGHPSASTLGVPAIPRWIAHSVTYGGHGR
jgi:hypothetical protein